MPAETSSSAVFSQQLAHQIRVHAGALSEIREAIGAPPAGAGQPTTRCSAFWRLGCALADLDEAAAQLSGPGGAT